MLDLAWIKDKRLIEQTDENSWRNTPIDHIGIDNAIEFIQRTNKKDDLHFADKTASLSRYSRIGLTITPAYLNLRGSNSSRRRRIHPLGLIQYFTASLLIGGNTFSESGNIIECAKAKEDDVFYGSICFYIKELKNLREVLPMDDRDKLNLSKVFGGELEVLFPQLTMATETALFEKLRTVHIEKHIRPDYAGATGTYTAFWEMMYYRTFCGCFNRYMPEVLQLALG